MLYGDTRMILIRILMVAEEEHIGDERIQTVTQPDFLFIRNTGESSLHLALGVVFLLHTIAAIVGRFQIFFLHFLSTLLEDTLESPVHDVRLQEEFILEMESISLNFFTGHWECR